MAVHLALQREVVGHLAGLVDLPGDLVVGRVEVVVVRRLRAVGVVAAQEVLQQLLIVIRRREPQLVLHRRAGEPEARIPDVVDVGTRLEFRVGRQHRGRHRRQQIGFQLVAEVVEAHTFAGAAEHPAAVKLIRAGLGHHVEHEAAARRLGRIVPCQEIAFRECVGIEIHRGAVSLAVEARHVHPVDVVAALVVRSSHGDPGLQERFRAAHVDLADRDARNDPRDRPYVHAVGQRLEHLLRENRLLQRRRGVEQRRFAAHDDAFFHRADLQPRVRARGLVGVHRDAGSRKGPETLERGFDTVACQGRAAEIDTRPARR